MKTFTVGLILFIGTVMAGRPGEPSKADPAINCDRGIIIEVDIGPTTEGKPLIKKSCVIALNKTTDDANDYCRAIGLQGLYTISGEGEFDKLKTAFLAYAEVAYPESDRDEHYFCLNGRQSDGKWYANGVPFPLPEETYPTIGSGDCMKLGFKNEVGGTIGDTVIMSKTVFTEAFDCNTQSFALCQFILDLWGSAP